MSEAYSSERVASCRDGRPRNEASALGIVCRVSDTALQLRSLLDDRGVFRGRIQLDDVWPALRQWVLVVSHIDELVVMYASSLLAREQGFAGEPPIELAERDVWSLEWTRSGPVEPPRTLDARLRLWFEQSDAWAGFRLHPDFLDAGPSTPHLDWPLAARERALGLDKWHDHTLLGIGRAGPVVALSLVDASGLDEVVIVRRHETFRR